MRQGLILPGYQHASIHFNQNLSGKHSCGGAAGLRRCPHTRASSRPANSWQLRGSCAVRTTLREGHAVRTTLRTTLRANRTSGLPFGRTVRPSVACGAATHRNAAVLSSALNGEQRRGGILSAHGNVACRRLRFPKSLAERVECRRRTTSPSTTGRYTLLSLRGTGCS